MTGRSAKVVAAVLVCAAVAGGAVATAVLVFPRAAPALVRKLANSFPKTRQEELETVLQRAARRLDGTMRTRLAEAIVSESERFGYDPFFILGLVSVESGFRGLSCAVVDALPEPGGQVAAMYPEKLIYDIAGIPAIRGRDLVAGLLEQASQNL